MPECLHGKKGCPCSTRDPRHVIVENRPRALGGHWRRTRLAFWIFVGCPIRGHLWRLVLAETSAGRDIVSVCDRCLDDGFGEAWRG